MADNSNKGSWLSRPIGKSAKDKSEESALNRPIGGGAKRKTDKNMAEVSIQQRPIENVNESMDSFQPRPVVDIADINEETEKPEKKESIFNRPIGGGSKGKAGDGTAKKGGALSRPIGKRSGGKGAVAGLKVPTKRTINLATVGVKKVKVGMAIPGIIIIIIAAIALGKFGVADRLTAMSAAQGRASEIQGQVSEAYQRIEDFDDMKDQYAHYTYSGMTDEELSLVSRVEVVDMINRLVTSKYEETGWTLSGNQLTITVSGNTLEEINLLAREFEQEDLVSYCTVTTARMNESSRDLRDQVLSSDTIVMANIEVYLANPEPEQETLSEEEILAQLEELTAE